MYYVAKIVSPKDFFLELFDFFKYFKDLCLGLAKEKHHGRMYFISVLLK